MQLSFVFTLTTCMSVTVTTSDHDLWFLQVTLALGYNFPRICYECDVLNNSTAFTRCVSKWKWKHWNDIYTRDQNIRKSWKMTNLFLNRLFHKCYALWTIGDAAILKMAKYSPNSLFTQFVYCMHCNSNKWKPLQCHIFAQFADMVKFRIRRRFTPSHTSR